MTKCNAHSCETYFTPHSVLGMKQLTCSQTDPAIIRSGKPSSCNQQAQLVPLWKIHLKKAGRCLYGLCVFLNK